MTNEIRLVDEWGTPTTITDLRKPEYLENLDTERLEDLAYTAKALATPIKNINNEVKARLDVGTQFVHITQTESHTKSLAQDDEKLKKAFVKKYGWDAVQVKTPTALKKQFGEAIQEDLDKVVVYDTQKRVKYD
jgi:hypothetical protein